MLRLVPLVLLALLALSGCTGSAAPGQSGAAPLTEGAPRTITVGGTGSVQVVPDVAFVTLGVETRGKTAAEAQSANAATMASVVDAIKRQNVPETAIQTLGLSLSSIVDTDNQVAGYQAQNHVAVRVTDLARVGPIIDAAVAAGSNTSGGVRFEIADEAAARQRALDLAARDARAKADAIAKAIGVQVSAVESAVEETSSRPIPLDAAQAGSRAAAAPDTPVELGELAVTANLRVVYGY